MENKVMDSVSSHAAGRGLDRSPVKSPAKAGQRQAAAGLGGHDDVLRDRPSDQKTTAQPLQQATNVEKPNRYIHLLNMAYPASKSKLTATSDVTAATTAGVSPAAAIRQQPATMAKPASSSSSADSVQSVARSAGAGIASPVAPAKTTPLGRASRPKASILDPSLNTSTIPVSPAAAASGLPSPVSTKDRTAQAQADGNSLARRSMPASAAAGTKPQYAFGSRIDANAARKPSPMRRSAPGTAAVDRSRASPQRMPSAARSAATSGPMRSSSAPRMAPEKVQSRFAVHQANAVAEQRSKTPNPAARARAAAASPSFVPGSKAKSATTDKHVSRLRASQEGLNSRVPAFSAGRSASPSTSTRAAARSLPAAASPVGTANRSSATGSTGTGGLLRQSQANGVQRMLGSRAERASAAVGPASSKAGVNSIIGIPTIQDRYKSGYKHTPAAAAVAEARAAAAETTAPVPGPAVPKLSLGALLSSNDTTALSRTRHRDEGTSSQQQQAPQALGKLPQRREADQHSHGSQAAASPFLGRMSTAAPAHGAPAQQQAPAMHTPQRGLLPLHTAGAASTPAGVAPSPAGSVYYTPIRADEQHQTPESKQTVSRIPEGEGCLTPPPLQRELSCGPEPTLELHNEVSRGWLSRANSKQLERQASIPCLSAENSNLSIDSALAVAAKGLVLPLHKLEESPCEFSSPPKHRRGDRGSPKGAAAICSQLLKSKASSICSGGGAAADNTSTAESKITKVQEETAGEVPAPVLAAPASRSPTKASRRTPGSAGAVPTRLPGLARRSVGSALDSAEKLAAKGHTGAAGFVTPKASIRLAAASGSADKAAPGSSPGDKLRMIVPKLDLTPVLIQKDEDEQADQEAAAQQQQQAAVQPLALEYHDSEQSELSGQAEADQAPGSRGRSGREGRPRSGSSAARRGSSSSSRGGARAAGSNRKSSTQEQSAQPESYYVYEAVMPTEETRTYEELRRALLRCPGGQKLAANLQGLWGCYQDARKATEAMAFRGHRLLDQVSNEYCSYKRQAEEQLVHLQQERDNLQLALTTTGGTSSILDAAHKDQQVRDLQLEVEQMRLQMEEMNKAMQKAADYHYSQQADQVNVKARTISGSATTSILFNQSLAQQQELTNCRRELEEMKAALIIACGALKETNYMDPNGHVRATLQPDTVQVLDMMIESTAAEATIMGHGAEFEGQPHVHIEELHDGHY